MDLGANIARDKDVFFRVWAPLADTVSVIMIPSRGEREFALASEDRGYFAGTIDGAFAGDRYFFLLDRRGRYPDPASRFQPDGVHGPSQITDPDEFLWSDEEWKGIPLQEFIIYELHVGAFTKEGTFEAIIPQLDYLTGLGITAIELMPVAQFPGGRNWGYDGAYPFAPQNTYGGPDGLKKLINAAHKKGLSVILDVVYNHLGPEGNYLQNFGHYFTDRYKSYWGDAINFDGPHSDEVRHFFVNNAIYWINEYHVDALRIDAVHGILDFSARHFLEELRETITKKAKTMQKKVYLIAESDLNDVRIINPADIGGYALDAQWNDDLHHSLHTLLTGENAGYYEDFGKISHLEKALREGFVYSGQHSAFRKRRFGNSSKNRPAQQFIVYSQSHDQVGNRAAGDRLSTMLPFEKLKLAAGVVLLSPYIPLLFMGEEYAETAPFLYFISHSDDELAGSVKRGRKEMFASFGWKEDIPDPQDESTFLNSKLTIDLHKHEKHRVLYEFYKELIRLRKEIPALRNSSKENMEVISDGDRKSLSVRRRSDDDEIFILYNFSEDILKMESGLADGTWNKVLESSSIQWGGEGDLANNDIESHGGVTIHLQPYSFVLLSHRHSREGGNPGNTEWMPD